ncbi:MAG: catechol 2,3-dioxygenase-like lactoylglutathione lyase family enzyme [Candidatus Azotimanducaceae bacterium]|jgi:catechol 2,3-dioxygenase-like lactoylglutathione lyase family enzyme
MFSHIMIGANDINDSKKFYDAILGALGHAPGIIDPKGRCFYRTETGTFSLSVPINGQPASHGNGSTIGFAAEDTAAADAWHAAGLANGGTDCENPPGVRQGTNGSLYLAYLRDPADNKICALYRI